MVLLPGAHAMLSRRQALVGVGAGLAAMAAGYRRSSMLYTLQHSPACSTCPLLGEPRNHASMQQSQCGVFLEAVMNLTCRKCLKLLAACSSVTRTPREAQN
jgi:hypothetical protein